MNIEHMHTQAVHAGEHPDPSYGDNLAPIHMATTYYLGSAEEGASLFTGERDGYVYNRWGSPNQTMLEEKVAALEGAESALATATGMAAISTALFSVLKAGDHVVATDALYSGTQHVIAHELPRFGIETTMVDAVDPANVERALRPNTVLLYLETPGNPTLKISDIAALTAIARRHGILSFLDNTFATSINQRPLELGVDLVLYSATKYMAGHGQAMGGMMAGSRALIDRARTGALRYLGGTISPFNAWLIMLGMHTYPLRVERQSQSALELARWLEDHPAVSWVRYPGLESHPQYAIARKQMRGFGGMICFELRGGVEAGRRMMNRIKVATLAVSLGHTKTLVCHAASTTHSTLTPAERQAAGVTDGLVRLSVGLEAVADLMQDLDQAMRA
jgi:cystathionine beta-lyase/cystathionine gamma-synthase